MLRNIVILIVLSVLVACCQCEQDKTQEEAHNELSIEERRALSRDNLGRADPDALLNGFIPVWAGLIYILAGN
jgi:hypothetical protein